MKTNLVSLSGQQAKTKGENDGCRQWSGDVDDKELVKPGGILMAALISCVSEFNITLSGMADELNVSKGYINNLRNGFQKTESIGDDFSRAISDFLGVSHFTVLMMAGKITPDDVFEGRILIAAEISRAMAYICSDPNYGHLVTSEIRLADSVSHFSLIKMYEGTTGKVLLDRSLTFDNVKKKVEEFEDVASIRKAQVDAYIERKNRFVIV
ncbi:MAG: helix-turn-helix transcriptional regulator [bacterium]